MKTRTANIMMVRPSSFGVNQQTAETNAFQKTIPKLDDDEIRDKAIQEFDHMVQTLKANGIKVAVIFDSKEPEKPDAIFPNNWVTFQEDGTVVLFPMCAPNRRFERRRSILDLIGSQFEILNEVDLSHYEEDNIFLEGTGSMVLDKANKICYACISERTYPELLKEYCEKFSYKPVIFEALDEQDFPIYHTNVMLSVADKFVVVCLDSVKNPEEKENLVSHFKSTNKEIINISFSQMKSLAGNVIELENDKGENILVMSEQARQSFREEQLQIINKFAKIVAVPIPTIERIGGGGTRCMIAEIFLPEKKNG
ncbi:citrulline utilization hydrolase CtlX [Flexithrix dorotheae]|uniref:citrulline utilization hydrolase CtlX n=1 Tax=Flexithrix dorotheae TaxID=70993 RepID=UPI00035D95FC|nr:arginine deiminase-related protein [Flexithrix dorotheae]